MITPEQPAAIVAPAQQALTSLAKQPPAGDIVSRDQEGPSFRSKRQHQSGPRGHSGSLSSQLESQHAPRGSIGDRHGVRAGTVYESDAAMVTAPDMGDSDVLTALHNLSFDYLGAESVVPQLLSSMSLPGADTAELRTVAQQQLSQTLAQGISDRIALLTVDPQEFSELIHAKKGTFQEQFGTLYQDFQTRFSVFGRDQKQVFNRVWGDIRTYVDDVSRSDADLGQTAESFLTSVSGRLGNADTETRNAILGYSVLSAGVLAGVDLLRKHPGARKTALQTTVLIGMFSGLFGCGGAPSVVSPTVSAETPAAVATATATEQAGIPLSGATTLSAELQETLSAAVEEANATGTAEANAAAAAQRTEQARSATATSVPPTESVRPTPVEVSRVVTPVSESVTLPTGAERQTEGFRFEVVSGTNLDGTPIIREVTLLADTGLPFTYTQINHEALQRVFDDARIVFPGVGPSGNASDMQPRTQAEAVPVSVVVLDIKDYNKTLYPKPIGQVVGNSGAVEQFVAPAAVEMPDGSMQLVIYCFTSNELVSVDAEMAASRGREPDAPLDAITAMWMATPGAQAAKAAMTKNGLGVSFMDGMIRNSTSVRKAAKSGLDAEAASVRNFIQLMHQAVSFRLK